MANPNIPRSQVSQVTTDQHGAALRQKPQRRWETATVWDYYPSQHAYRVRGSIWDADYIPRLLRDPGETAVLPRGTLVAIHDELGYPVIDSVIPAATLQSVSLNPIQITEVQNIGGSDPVYAVKGGASYCAPNAPTDVLSGDWVRRSPDGNLVAVLAGGMNTLQSAPMAQVRTHALDELVEIISANYRHLTSMGDLEIRNNEGKTSLKWRAGCDQSNETGANRGNWTIYLDIGATPAGDMFTLRITTPDAQDLCRVHMSADGKLELFGAAGIDLTSGDRGSMRADVAEDLVLDVRGKQESVVYGDVAKEIGGQRDVTISKNDSLVVGNSLSESVSQDRNVYVGHVINQKAQGGLSSDSPEEGWLAAKYEYINGGVETIVGNPKAQPANCKQGQNFINYIGGFNFAIQSGAEAPPVGGFNVICKENDSVKLGADGTATAGSAGKAHSISGIKAEYHAAMHEPWAKVMDKLLEWLDTHDHLTSMGPSGPAQTGTGLSVKLKVTKDLVDAVQSKRVAIGK